MISDAQRAAVVAEARTWINTPYHHRGRVKGAGTDCAMILCAVFERAGVTPRVEVEHYPPDWHLHRGVERYLGKLLEHGLQIDGPPLPADIAVFRFGRCFSHGAIVVEWPLVIHAMVRHPVGYADVLRDAVFREKTGALREMKFFRVNA